MNNERWILTGEFMNGDKYFESFDSIFELTKVMEQIYNDWLSSNGLDEFNTVNPFTLEMEQDLTDQERQQLSEQ